MKQLHKIVSTLILGLMTLYCGAQNEMNIWYFGLQAGIDFNTTPPTVLVDGALETNEACSSISDANGNLLFYTNGSGFTSFNGGVYDKNHQMMPNGDLNTATTCNSSAQGALIIPDPSDSNKYFIFTTPCQENGLLGGLKVHKVDLSLNNGLGDVTTKDSLIYLGTTESLLGIKHGNDRDYWIITCEKYTNNYHITLVDELGIHDTQTISIGMWVPGSAGHLSTNLVGNKVVYSTTNDTYLFDFDNLTGNLTNYISLGFPSFSNAFSRSGNFLYVCYNYPYDIFQYDMTSMSIPTSATHIATNNVLFGGMKLAPDGKIYISQNGLYLSVINNPDSLGLSCNFVESSFYLNGKSSSLSLPNFPNYYSSNSVGINETIKTTNITLYPNPTTKNITINLGETLTEIRTTLTNTLGQVILTQQFESTDFINIDIDAPNGIYFLQLEVNGEVITRKIIKK